MMSKIIMQKEVDPELHEAYRVFNQFEGEGIDAQELRGVMAKFKIEITEQDAEDLIKTCDWDGDGQLNFDEFCMLMMDRET